MSEVAFIGLGTMGRGIARNLVRAGHTVTAWNRTQRACPTPNWGAISTHFVGEADPVAL